MATHGSARDLVRKVLEDALDDIPEATVGVVAFVAWDEDGTGVLSTANAGGAINFATVRRCFTCWESKFKQIAAQNGWPVKPEPEHRPEEIEAAASLVCSLFADVAEYTPEEFSRVLFPRLKALATALGHPLKDMLPAKAKGEARETLQ